MIVDLFVSNKRGKADQYKSYNLVCLYNLSLFSQGEKEMAQSVTFLGGIKVNLHLSYVSSLTGLKTDFCVKFSFTSVVSNKAFYVFFL